MKQVALYLALLLSLPILYFNIKMLLYDFGFLTLTNEEKYQLGMTYLMICLPLGIVVLILVLSFVKKVVGLQKYAKFFVISNAAVPIILYFSAIVTTI